MAARRGRIAVIGAGAAGSMAAIFAAAGDQETILIERTPDGGRKILISGGGRCNVLPSRADESRFVTDSAPRAMQRMLRSWPLREQIPFFESELGIPLAEEPESAKLFPASNRARDVRDALLALARRRGVTLMMDTLVTGLAPTGEGWRIESAGAPPIEARKVIVATGGLSVPKSGSDGLGLSILETLGHTIHPTYPALTPLTAPESPFTSLAGLSLPVTITARSAERSASATGGFLFTHRGYSGPSVLDVSHVAVRTSEDGAAPAPRHGALEPARREGLADRRSNQGRARSSAPCARSCRTAWRARSAWRPASIPPARWPSCGARSGFASSKRSSAASCPGPGTRATRRPRSPGAA